tara:strand:- start:943 stop:1782 length:840 start_codon:yes stop_codon:yes gene_type:complete
MVYMYSAKDLETIARHYRQPVRPTELHRLADTKKYPNDILMSYLVADEKPTRQQLSTLLGRLKTLEGRITHHIPKPIPESELPVLYDGISYDMPTSDIAATIAARTGKFAMGHDNWLLVADPVKRTHTYPSGRNVSYSSLHNEQTANLSILFAGCTSSDLQEMYVRENFVTFITALMYTLKHDPRFERYKSTMKDFEHAVRGIILAHEIAEVQNLRSGKDFQGLERELASEEGARKFLVQQGVDPIHYELHHTLVESGDRVRGQNVSRIIVNQVLQPLA